MTLDEAYDWLELASEFAGEGATLDDERQVKADEAWRVVCVATGAPWWEYEGDDSVPAHEMRVTP